ncbi:Iron(3+)-hydroxamate import ATP-binding protein FhuC [Streptomyces sp. YIM 130001]|uniref:ABC transporter ATP-binding protein n=1 Tax=Streptomyces sp. YIM 130001 TaxID=2259644 RepID=UPI000E646BE3|nr:ABC transporter ATP-binding protein [Streptomyces sp. YIM 130001]RII19760.1 Iron(3+)-hydroxamate import ATP-binding protein FhuC [Streptomyces sp. YIM 130001]
MLRTEELSYRTAGRTLVDAVSLHAAPGETVGLVGPNGSGKTTLLRCVYGTLAPTGGRALLDGDDLHAIGAKRRARRLATVPQDTPAGFELTVREIAAMGRAPHKSFLAADTAQDDHIVDAALSRVGADTLEHRRFASLSGGERQRVLVARALVQQPTLLVLDEPTNHLDIRHQLEILGLVRTLGTTNLIALHDLNLAAYYCDRLYVLDHGRAVTSGQPAEVLTAELLADVYGVRAEVAEHPSTGAPTITYLPDRHRHLPHRTEVDNSLPVPTGEPKSSTM